ncbi:Protein DEL-7, partial [Aphelenchoides avenae]
FSHGVSSSVYLPLHARDLFLQWLNQRTLRDFYTTLFVENDHSCEQMFIKCEIGAVPVPCCDLFHPAFVMLRGRCWMLRPLQQRRPNYHGQLSVTLGMLPSWLVSPDGLQAPQPSLA